MLSCLKPRTPAVIGIDISSHFIKVFELSRKTYFSKVVHTVESYGVAPLPAQAVVENEIRDVAAVSGVLRSLLQSVSTQTRLGAVALLGNGVISKTINLPKGMTATEIEAHISMAADRYIPYPLADVFIDFQVLGPNALDPTQEEIVLVVARREVVESRMAVLSQAGLELKIVDLEVYAIERAVSLILPTLSGSPEMVAIVDVGATVMLLSILDRGRTVYTREQSFGGQQLTEEIQKRYNLPFQEALEKQKTGDLPADYEQEILEPYRYAVAMQVSRLLQLFFSSGHGEGKTAVDHILLAGGIATIPGMTAAVESRLKTPTTVANPLLSMEVAPLVPVDELMKRPASLLVCCGLALRSFDT